MIDVMRKLSGFFSAILMQLFLATPVFAQRVDVCPPAEPFNQLCKFLSGEDAFQKVVRFVVTLLLTVAVVVSLVFLIYGGIRWVISGGDKTAVENARNTIVAAIIGLVISLAAFFILNIIAQMLGIRGGLLDLPLPKIQP
mgnify:CR=1 FL=1